ncbi:hypothetical protein APW68_04580 [Staphylococcus aureus]|nr:hypothetical protein APW68_04580 [Staphylococcus aureus]
MWFISIIILIAFLIILMIIISIIYFKNLYIGRLDKPSSRKKKGGNLIFEIVYNNQMLNSSTAKL